MELGREKGACVTHPPRKWQNVQTAYATLVLFTRNESWVNVLVPWNLFNIKKNIAEAAYVTFFYIFFNLSAWYCIKCDELFKDRCVAYGYAKMLAGVYRLQQRDRLMDTLPHTVLLDDGEGHSGLRPKEVVLVKEFK